MPKYGYWELFSGLVLHTYENVVRNKLPWQNFEQVKGTLGDKHNDTKVIRNQIAIILQFQILSPLKGNRALLCN